MERNRGYKIISIIALIIAVVGVSLGFAAFSNTLVISSSADVQPNPSAFKVVFSSSSSSLAIGSINGVATSGATAGTATIVNNDTPSITNLTAGFTSPGQIVTYTFYVHNSGEYEAFLKNISYANVTGENSSRICTATSQETTDSLVSAACEDISLTIDVGDTNATGTLTSISNHALAKGDYEKVVITIAYADNGNRADGDFNVQFGDISLQYKSNDA